MAIACGVVVTAPTSGAQTSPPAFDASAAADGVRITFEVPGAPLTARLVDTGGPTAQVAVSSLGTSRGYAAMPDPGELVQSAPGLLVGLLNQGGFGLPPIDFPSLPDYPLLVTSDANQPRHAEIGAGPYELIADSEPNHSSVRATGGVTSPAGNVALVRSTAEAGVQEDGSILASASSDFQGLMVGPLSIGRVRSTATLSMTTDGRIERSTDLDVDAFRVGGVELEIAADQLRIAGQTIPLPLEQVLAELLGAAGFEVEYQAARETDNAVVAPTLVLTTQVENDIGTEPGTLTIQIGGATAALTGVGPPPSPTPPPAAGVTPPETSAGLAPSGAPLPSNGGGSVPAPASSATSETAAPVEGDRVVNSQTVGELVGVFDVLPAYLTIAGATAALYAISQLIRILGVRNRWT